jgi:hypothetical protein
VPANTLAGAVPNKETLMAEETTNTNTTTPAPAPSAADVQVAHAQHRLAEVTGGRFVPSMAKPSAPAAPTTPEAARQAIKDTASDTTLPAAVRNARLAELRGQLVKLNQQPATGAPASVVQEQTPPALSPVEALEAKRKALNDPTNADGIYAKDPTKRVEAMRQLRVLLNQQADAEQPGHRDNMTLEDRRAEFGVPEPRFLTVESAMLHDPDAEAEALDYAHGQGLTADVVRDAMGDYFKLAEMRDGPIDGVTLDRLEQKYIARGVSKAVTAAYRKWLRENEFI